MAARRADATSLTAADFSWRRIRFLAVAATAPAVLLLGHLMPLAGPGLALRLAGAAACILVLPGALILRCLAWPSSPGIAIAASFALSLTVVALALGLVFVVGASLDLAALVIVVVVVCAAVLAAFRDPPEALSRAERWAAGAALAVGAALGGVVWWAAGSLEGDVFFHLGRARKLAELDTLGTLTTVGEFEGGGLHPGYAFPLWQSVDALVGRFADADVADVVVYLPAVLVPLAFLLAYGAGSAVFGSRAGGLAFLAVQAGHFGFSGFFRRDGNRAGIGLFEHLSQPQAASHVLLLTAAVVLAFAFVRHGGWTMLAVLAAGSFALAAVHPTYAPYLALLLGGFVVARVLLVRGWERLLTRTALALGAILVPFGLVLIVLLPAVREASAHTPSAEKRAAELANYGPAFTSLGGWIGLAPDAIARTGPVIVAGLLTVPLAAFAARRLWAALVLGGSLAILAVVLIPPLFTALSDVFTLSQSRRLPQFLPIAFALAGGCVVLSRLRWVGVGVAGAAGLALALIAPGEFAYRFEQGGPAWAIWVAVVGGLAALAVGFWLRPQGPDAGYWATAAAIVFVLPVAVAGLAGLSETGPRSDLTPDIIAAVRSETDARDVVFSDPRTAYMIAGFAPVYINAAPTDHATDTPGRPPRARVLDARRFFASRSATAAERRAILERYGADWVLVDKRRKYPEEFLRQLRVAHDGGRFALYEVGF
jgi:hypothetical protein